MLRFFKVPYNPFIEGIKMVELFRECKSKDGFWNRKKTKEAYKNYKLRKRGISSHV